MKAVTRGAYELMHEGSLALSEVEATGMPIDEAYLDGAVADLSRDIKSLQNGLRETSEFAKWHKHFGESTKLSSRDQFAHVVFKILGIKSKGDKTDTGRDKANESAFEDIDLPFVKDYIKLQRKLKDRDTFLMGIKRETVKGRLHSIQNLNTTKSYRSSTDSPNSQNWPIRDPERGKLIRSCFIPPSDDYCLVESDFKGIEVKGNACHSRDPNLIRYVTDPTTDMHRDMSAQIYMLKPQEVSKHSRYCAKNMFVFPQFYGDWYKASTRQMWEAITKMSLKAGDVPMLEHLARHGITERGLCDPKEDPVKGTFEYHMKKVEDDFRGNRFKVHWEWMERWYMEYRDRGGFQMFTGFWCDGLMNKKEAVNYPVQGSSFHCLLWSLIQIVKRIRKRKMLSRVIAQIHDSIIAYVHKSEYEDYLALVHQVMTKDIREHWDWIIVPLEIEVEVCPYGANWSTKQAIDLSTVL